MNYQKTDKSVRSMFSSIAGKYDRTNTILSFGIHSLWKKKFINSLPIPGCSSPKILDLCTGTGDLVPLLKEKFQGSIIGGDFCEPMLEVARKRFPQEKFQFCDALKMDFADDSLDLVTVAYGVRNFEDLRKGLSEIFRTLKAGGVLGVLEFGQPKNPLIRASYSFYSKHILPVIGYFVTGDKNAYTYLNETSQSFPCDAEFGEILKEIGFSNVKIKPLFFGVTYIYSAEKNIR